MSKKKFCKSIETLKTYVDFQIVLSVNYGYTVEKDNVGLALIEVLIELIEGFFPKKEIYSKTIEDFCWGSQFGKKPILNTFTKEPIKTPEELWEFLEMLKEKE